MNTIIFADKKNFRSLKYFSEKVLIIPSEYLRLNFHRNPVSFDLSKWLNEQMSLYTGFDLRFPSISHIRKLTDELCKKWGFTGQRDTPCPNLPDIFKYSSQRKLRFSSVKQQYRERAEDRISSILDSTEHIFQCTFGIDLDRLTRQNVVIELFGLNPLVKIFIISGILAYLYFSKLSTNDILWKNEHIACMIDEGQEVFRRVLEVNDFMPFTDKFISIAREQNICLVTGSQVYRDASQNLKSNSSTIIGCGFPDNRELRTLCNSFGIRAQEKMDFVRKALKPGRVIVSTTKYPEPFLINVPYFPELEREVSDKEIYRDLLKKADQIYHPTEVGLIELRLRTALGITTEAIQLPYVPSTQSKEQKVEAPDNTPANNHRKPAHSHDKLHEDALRFVRCVIENKLETRFLLEILPKLNITAGSQKIKLKEYLIKMGWAKAHTIQIVRNQCVILEMLEPAYKLCNVTVRVLESKGDFPHKVMFARKEEYDKARGLKVRGEYVLSNGKAIDQLSENEVERFFTEFANTKIESEQNIIDDLSTPLQPSKLLICCKNSKLRNAQEAFIKSNSNIAPYRDIISVHLASEFFDLDTNPRREGQV